MWTQAVRWLGSGKSWLLLAGIALFIMGLYAESQRQRAVHSKHVVVATESMLDNAKEGVHWDDERNKDEEKVLKNYEEDRDEDPIDYTDALPDAQRDRLLDVQSFATD